MFGKVKQLCLTASVQVCARYATLFSCMIALDDPADQAMIFARYAWRLSMYLRSALNGITTVWRVFARRSFGW